MTGRTRCAAAVLVLALTGCSAATPDTAGPTPLADGSTEGTGPSDTGPIETAAPAPPSDPVLATLRAVAEVGLTQEALLDPGRDTKQEMSGAVQPLLTPAAYARYVKGLPDRQEDTDLTDGSSWQLVVHTALTPGDVTRTVDHAVLGPLSVTETGRSAGPDGNIEVTGTAAQDYESVVIEPTGPVAGHHRRPTRPQHPHPPVRPAARTGTRSGPAVPGRLVDRYRYRHRGLPAPRRWLMTTPARASGPARETTGPVECRVVSCRA